MVYVGQRPPITVCTHRILFEPGVEVGLYSGETTSVRRRGPRCTERERVMQESDPGAKTKNTLTMMLLARLGIVRMVLITFPDP